MTLVRNEQTKLTAQAFDRASTACLTVGVIAPVAATFYNVGNSSVGLSTLVIGTSIWLGAAIALHWSARRLLRTGPMTPTELFAFVILPISIASAAWAYVLISERVQRRRNR
ncbi:hypothetical protein Sa4125_09840 [Aureimonas sp. SA4125]|uniref:hypothetical protein n=1 Tax=Aureimonas sp. SA4125 TaxID=2826993 RepID=UPI001CC6883F|nr:hypothetical protein [Aureimonas sp. SA4125]BDA83442.1 hypothetical protein Sa4125_09840 [Aureimonas sp. SA4125]